jgi:hypothetical protein
LLNISYDVDKPVLTGASVAWAHVGMEIPIKIDKPRIAMFLGDDMLVT